MSFGALLAAADCLRQTLAALPSFYAFCNVQNREDALEKIHDDGLPRPANHADTYAAGELAAYRPCAILSMALESGFKAERDSSDSARASGRLILKLFANVAEEDLIDGMPIAAKITEFKQSVGLLIDELMGVDVLNAGQFAPDTLAVDYGPYACDPLDIASQGGWQGIDIGLDWSGV